MRKRKGTLVNLILLLLIAALYYVTSRPDAVTAMAAFSGSPVYRGHAEGRIALQFAVSWNAAAVEDILHVLSEKGKKATFAVSGAWARDNEALLRRMAQEGHELAVMGDDSASDGSISFLVKDIRAALDAVEAACGIRPKIYYSGTRSIRNSARAAKKLGLTHVLETLDLRTASGNAAAVAARGLEGPIAGSILLLQPTAAAAEALPALIDGLQKKGLEAVPTGCVLGLE
ncbi:MAG: hypothetical protein E7330_04275 [Clostridiales bacterium]|nr:hypothetical protein [Clostridiales bacterium]